MYLLSVLISKDLYPKSLAVSRALTAACKQKKNKCLKNTCYYINSVGGGQGGLNLPLPVSSTPTSCPFPWYSFLSLCPISIAKYYEMLRNFSLFLPSASSLPLFSCLPLLFSRAPALLSHPTTKGPINVWVS